MNVRPLRVLANAVDDPAPPRAAAAAPELLDLRSTPLAIVDAQRRVAWTNAVLAETWCERRLAGSRIEDLAIGDDALPALVQRVLVQRERIVARRLLLEFRREHPRRFDVALAPVAWQGEVAALLEFHALSEHDQDLGEGVVQAPEPAAQQMARALAHEIKNPLAGLHGAAQLLERELPNKALREYTTVIRAEADRIRRLVDRLLQKPDVAHAGQAFNVHEVLERVRTLIEAEAAGRAGVVRDYDPSLPDIDGHPDRLTQALLNLARNALQSGARTVRLRTRAERRARIGEHVCKLALRIDVCDDGPGVPEALRESLFLPFVTGRDEGTGLGLPVALAIAREHGGTLAFVSRPGSTTFSLLIPVQP
ncbi:MAG: PAS domain-containing sensor histidine kinase [Xanthomonadales bacterium]|nr:PAS domain-containing sensor histidine kinase [Xanthomonadales bacterium]